MIQLIDDLDELKQWVNRALSAETLNDIWAHPHQRVRGRLDVIRIDSKRKRVSKIICVLLILFLYMHPINSQIIHPLLDRHNHHRLHIARRVIGPMHIITPYNSSAATQRPAA